MDERGAKVQTGGGGCPDQPESCGLMYKLAAIDQIFVFDS